MFHFYQASKVQFSLKVMIIIKNGSQIQKCDWIWTENTVWMGEKWKTFLVPLQSPRTDMRYFL